MNATGFSQTGMSKTGFDLMDDEELNSI